MKFYGYPHMYYSRAGVCDLKFVLSRMNLIPENLKLEVSKKYESFGPVHGGEKRKAANIWLNGEALKYERAPTKKAEVKECVDLEPKPLNKPVFEFKSEVDTNAPPIKRSFLDSLLDDVDKNNRLKHK